MKVIAFIKKAKPDIDRLYNEIKTIGFSGISPKSASATWKAKVMNYFHARQGSFNIVIKEDLNDDSLFALSPGQEKRDFIGRLLHKLVKRYLHIYDISNDKLYTEYKQLQPSYK